MLELIRASSLQGYPELVRSLHGEPDALLAEAGIAPQVVGDIDAYIPYRAVASALERAARTLACPDFGLRLSGHRGPEILGPVALIARHATTVGDGLRDLAKYLHTYSTAIRITIQPLLPGEARYTVSFLTSGLSSRTQISELGLGLALQAFRMLTGPRFRPLRVAIPHRPQSEPARYRAFFDADVQFDQDRCGFDFASDALAKRVAYDDALIRDLASRYLDSAAPPAAAGAAAATKSIVLRTLPTGQCSITNVARDLAVNPRTLQRTLAAEGIGFAEILDDVRREQSRHYLETSDMPLGQLSSLLGYTEQSSLSRACRGWFGAAPRTLRRRAKACGDS